MKNKMAGLPGCLMVGMYDENVVVTMKRHGAAVLVSRTSIAVANWKDCSVAWCVKAARIVESNRSH